MINSRIGAAFFLTLIFLQPALAQSPFVGSYYWETPDGETTSKYVEARIKTSSTAVLSIEAEVVWSPGAHVELSGEVASSNVSTRSEPDGTITYLLDFNFEDSFGNKGSGNISAHGDTCILKLTASEVNDTRAVRQYSDYTLQRQAISP